MAWRPIKAATLLCIMFPGQTLYFQLETWALLSTLQRNGSTTVPMHIIHTCKLAAQSMHASDDGNIDTPTINHIWNVGTAILPHLQ